MLTGKRTRGAVLELVGASRPYAASRPLTICPIELEAPRAGEVLVRVRYAGICHSDLSVVNGDRQRPTPMLLGHEASGIVEECGPRVEGLRPGDQVVMTFLPRCGACAGCSSGGQLPCGPGSEANSVGELLGGGVRVRRDGAAVAHHLGVSAFAAHAIVDRRSLVKVSEDVPGDVAALLGCAVLTGGGAVINAGRPHPGDPVIVVGLGGVGMAALMVAVALGHPTIGVDAVHAKLQRARAFGAQSALTPDEAESRGVSAPVVVEAAGSARAFETAISLTAPGGTTVTVGLPPPDAAARISPAALTSQARSVVGSYLGSAVPERDIPLYVQLWREGRLPLEDLVSRRVRLEDINEAMDRLACGGELRQLVELGEDSDVMKVDGSA